MVWVATAILAPPTASAETVSPRRLLEVADFGTPVISPDGALVAFRVEQASVERNTYDTVWYVQRVDGAARPRRLADGGVTLRDSAGGSLSTPPVWSPDGRWIYYRALLDGRIDVWRAAVDGSGAEPLTADPADVRAFSLSAQGNTLQYSVGASRQEVQEAEQAEYDQGIRIDATVPIGQPLYRSGNLEGRWATQRFSGVWFDRRPLLAGIADRWKTIELNAMERREPSPRGDASASPTVSDLARQIPGVTQAAIEREGRIAVLIRHDGATDAPSGSGARLAILSGTQAKTPLYCRAEPCQRASITHLQWRPSSDEVVFTVTDPREALAQSIYRWNVRSGRVILVAWARGWMNGGRDRSSPCGISAAALVCVTAKADRPPRLETIDLQSGRRAVLFDPNQALALDIATLTPARLLRWSDAAGRTFTGQLFAARRFSAAAPPLFVTYYNCEGFLRGGVGDEWPLASLAERGIAALCINRGPRQDDALARFGEGLSAVESAVALLASQGEIDRSRVGMGGLSFGSETALWVAAESSLLSAVSVTSPAVSPNYYLFGSLKGDAFLAQLKKGWSLGAPEETGQRWEKLSPAANLDKIHAPILMQMPEQEYLYALEYAIPLMRSGLADLYAFPNEPHQKFQPRHKLAAYERNLDWFRFWLLKEEDSAPAKASQYRHWRQMGLTPASSGNGPTGAN